MDKLTEEYIYTKAKRLLYTLKERKSALRRSYRRFQESKIKADMKLLDNASKKSFCFLETYNLNNLYYYLIGDTKDV